MVDLHIHTDFSPDGKNSIEEVIMQSKINGVGIIAISDHYDLVAGPYIFNKIADLKKYNETIDNYKREESEIKILKSLEFGIQSFISEELKDDYDFLLYSVHHTKKVFTDLPRDDTDLVWKLYLEEAVEAVKDIDHIGFYTHLDLMKRYLKNNPEVPKKYEHLVVELLKRIVKYDLGLEINTAGWRMPFKEQQPKVWIIEKYFELGGRYISIGSDSHNKKTIGCGYYQAVDLLKKIGINEIFYGEGGNYVRYGI
ncbi:MAG: histidinol-phosphatase family [Kosmotogales bacterium]|nr:histidinol-phosphatase family [Kosmotogales bacterium]